jgi:hypothetical protein
MSFKICTMGDEAGTEWNPVSRISGVLTTNEDILKALSREESQGVYAYAVTENGTSVTKIGINASAIKAGAIYIGGEPKFNSNGTLNSLNGNKFYANVEN